MKGILVRFSNWKFILPAFLACAFCIYLFQGYQAEMSEIMGEEAIMIDMRSGYGLTEINDFFSKLKQEGRQIHAHATRVTDMFFPFVYGPLFILVIAFFIKKIAGPTSNWMYLSLLPALLMLLDFKENLNTLHLLKTYPDLTSEMVESAARITDLKSLFVNISMVFPILLAMIWAAMEGLKRYKKTP